MTTRNIQLHSLALAGILALGATIALLTVGMMVGETIVYWCLPYKSPEALVILPNGTPVICSDEADDEGPICRGLDGRRVKASRSHPGSNAPQQATCSRLPSQFDPKAPFRELRWYLRLVQLENQNQRDVSMAWYFVHDGKLAGHGYFVGFDTKTNLKIGYIGRNGDCAARPTLDEQLPIDGRRMLDQPKAFFVRGYYDPADLDSHYVAMLKQQGQFYPFSVAFLTDDGLMRVNVKEQTVTCLRKDSTLIAAAMAARVRTNDIEPASSGKDAENSKQAYLLRSPDRVHVVDMAGKEIQTYLLPTELRNCGFKWLRLPDDNVLIVTGRWGYDNELFWIDPKGNILRHETVQLERYSNLKRLKQDFVLAMIAPSPAAVTVLAACAPGLVSDDCGWLSYWDVLRKMLTEGWVRFVVAAFSIIAAVLCYRRQQKYALPWTAAWIVFVFLTGLPGYIGYLAHRRWPARLPCPHCGQRVPRDRPACFACKHDFPAPPAKGIEVFA